MPRTEALYVGSRTTSALYEHLYTTIIEGERLTYLGLILKRAATTFGNDVALVCDGSTVTYRALYYRALRVSMMLVERGIKPHDRVVMLIENSIAFYVAYFGILQVGAVVVPLNTFLHERELAHIMHDAQPALLVCSSAQSEKLRACSPKPLPIIDESMLFLDEQAPTTLPTFNIVELPFDDMTALLYTSGTTGFPKGVMLSSRNILTNVMGVITRFGILKQQRIIAILPLFHSLGQNVCVWSAIVMGCTVIVVPKIERRALLSGFNERPTIFVGVPALFGVLCLLRNVPLETVEYFFSGGDAMPDKIRKFFSLIYRRKICSGYGITEASPVVSLDTDDTTEPTHCAGRPLDGVECSVRDEEGKSLPACTIGHLWIKGDTIMLGYYGDDDATRAAMTGGWLKTGDLAYRDDKGRIVITGRIKDLIINKGIKIYPQEVENVILLHENVVAAAVIGIDDPGEGQFPCAYVQIRRNEPACEEELARLCHDHLAPYKIPRRFVCTTSALPTTATGKVDKKVLRKNYDGEFTSKKV